MLATQRGKHPSRLIEDFVSQGLESAAEEDEFCPVDVRIMASLQDIRRRARMRSQLVQIAFEHQQQPTEETADILKSLCEAAEIPLEDVIRESSDTPIVPLVDDDNINGVNAAMRWLHTVIEAGEEYPVMFLLDLAHQVGFTDATVKSAKQLLGIISKRKSKGWVWSLPEIKDNVPVSHQEIQ